MGLVDEFNAAIGGLARGDSDAQIDVVLRFFDRLLREGRISDCDLVLENADVQTLTPRQIVAVLTVTGHAKTCLRRRAAFYERAEALIRSTNPDECGAILHGLC